MLRQAHLGVEHAGLLQQFGDVAGAPGFQDLADNRTGQQVRLAELNNEAAGMPGLAAIPVNDPAGGCRYCWVENVGHRSCGKEEGSP